MDIIGIIPARYNSTRLKGKPLLQIKGKTMIQRVYESAKQCKSLKNLYIATDNKRIYDHAKDIGANVIMTSLLHKNGTSRCNEAINSIVDNCDYVINIQGDEPLIEPKIIDTLCCAAIKNSIDIATTISYISNKNELLNPSEAKVITDTKGYALYFSRAIIPFAQDNDIDKILKNKGYKKHLGLYIFRKEILNSLCKLHETPLSIAESLEQLIWIESGFKILTVIVNSNSIAIDTEEDLQKVIKILEYKNNN